jgi:hypothetical protein
MSTYQSARDGEKVGHGGHEGQVRRVLGVERQHLTGTAGTQSRFTQLAHCIW